MLGKRELAGIIGLVLSCLLPSAYATSVKVCAVPGCNGEQYCQNLTAMPIPFQQFCLSQGTNTSALVSCKGLQWSLYLYQVSNCPGTNYTAVVQGNSGDCTQGLSGQGKAAYYQVDCSAALPSLSVPSLLTVIFLLFATLFISNQFY
eukprot:gb/GEZN01023364.1/.p1 GENE.gb/GEZN01023364.1/~~gb/GEZN01023364.1/.p1  ORF type:complete len:147 (+),score=9.54 gb/GEZN01023364.1/:24-464(+)